MAMLQSLYDSGSDECRDNEVDPEACSHCATNGKLKRASYFCYNCGVFGRYICGICLTHHNRVVKSHRVQLISNQPMSRGQTLETELAKERKKVEELCHKLDNSMKQIHALEKELEKKTKTNLILPDESKQLDQRTKRTSAREPGVAHRTRAEENMSFSQELRRMGATIYEVRYEKTGNNQHELTVEKGDIVQVLDKSRNWWKLKNYQGETGYAPYTVLKEYQPMDDFDNVTEQNPETFPPETKQRTKTDMVRDFKSQ